MKIQICETTIATKNVEKLKSFYADVLGQNANVEHHDFFYKVIDKSSAGQVCIVPHNGEAKWNEPWITLATDDLKMAIEHIKKSGVDPETISPFGLKGDAGVCFQDPEGRLVMMLVDTELS